MGSLLTLEVLSPDSLLGQWVPHLLALLSILPPHAQGTNVQGHYSAFYAGAGDPKVLMFAQQTRYCLNHLPSPQLDHSLLGTLSYVCVCGGGVFGGRRPWPLSTFLLFQLSQLNASWEENCSGQYLCSFVRDLVVERAQRELILFLSACPWLKHSSLFPDSRDPEQVVTQARS